MFEFKKLKDAIVHAKGRLKQSLDTEVSSRSLVVEASPGGRLDLRFPPRSPLKGKSPPMSMSPHAETQIARMFNIPSAWIKVKDQMSDLIHLSESFNRHIQAAEDVSLTVRLYEEEIEGGAVRYVRAIWPSNTATLDILPTLRLMREHLLTHVTRWGMLHITGHTLRAYGHFKKKNPNTPTTPGIYVSTSEDGSFPIRVSLGVSWENPRQFCLLDSDPRCSDMFKRRESEEGDLVKRFTKSLHRMIEFRRTAWSNARQNLEAMKSIEIGSNVGAFLELARQGLKYPRSMDNIIMGAWNPTDHLAGFWRALMQSGYDQALHDKPDLSHKLLRAAGLLLSHGKHGLSRALAETSREDVLGKDSIKRGKPRVELESQHGQEA